MARFGQFYFGEGVFGDDDPLSWSPDSARVAWNFFDGVNSYDLPINPNQATMPTPRKRVTARATCSGRQVLYQGKPEVGTIEFSGVIFTEAQYRAFEDWFSKRKQIRITDDLGEKYWVYLKSFSPTRVKSSRHDWYHTYTASGVTLDRG